MMIEAFNPLEGQAVNSRGISNLIVNIQLHELLYERYSDCIYHNRLE